MPTFGSLFAGIGGIDLGLERAGWTGRWQVEYDPFCTRVLERHWPGLTRYGDIHDVDWSTVEPVDLVAGGFPCQPVSIAGRKGAQEDARWLWPEFARAIGVLRPQYVLVENVLNLLVVGRGSAFGDVLGDLAALGYDAEWDCIPAAAVGAFHLRDRVWVVAHPQRGELGQFDGARWATGAVLGTGREAVADADDQGPQGHGRLDREWDGPREWPAGTRGRSIQGQWLPEPNVGRVAHGVPARVDRLRSLGNAVVPQVVEVIGRQLIASLEEVAS